MLRVVDAADVLLHFRRAGPVDVRLLLPLRLRELLCHVSWKQALILYFEVLFAAERGNFPAFILVGLKLPLLCCQGPLFLPVWVLQH